MPSMRCLIRLIKYAELSCEEGDAQFLREVQLVINASIEIADFARRVQRAAYAAGAEFVTVIWGDQESSRIMYENVDLARLSKTPSWKIEQLNSLAEQGAAFLFLSSDDPNGLKGIDPEKPAAVSRARNLECDVFRNGMDFGKTFGVLLVFLQLNGQR